ncbi:hypothetical protein C2W62_20765, partial [Candidatus Entotheonella serta]
SDRYQFNKPKERLWHTLKMAGPRSILSFNLNKLMRDVVALTKLGNETKGKESGNRKVGGLDDLQMRSAISVK